MEKFLINSYTRTGLSHMEGGRIVKPCEDVTASAFDKAGRVRAIALSDGCGTAVHAREGAVITAQMAADIAAERFDELYNMTPKQREETLLLDIRRALFREASKLGADIADLSCTLLVSALRDDGKAFFFHIGDGAVYARLSDGSPRLLSRYRHKYLNVTNFVTSVKPSARSGAADNVTGFFFFSDGPEPFLLKQSSSLELLIQLSHILPPYMMDAEFDAYTDRIIERGMYDDASFATLSLSRYTADVFRDMFCRSDSRRKLRRAMFGGVKKQTVNKYASVLEYLSQAENGADIKSLTKLMRTHRRSHTYKRLFPLIYQGIICEENGRFYLER